MADILNIGVSGLRAAQRALSTTGHNISNVNTPGYTRQRVDLSARQDQTIGGLTLGRGVNVDQVSRIMNQFLSSNVQTSATNVGTVASYNTYSSQVDKILANEATGLSPSMQDFFNSVNALADDPSSLPTRQAMIGSAETLSAKFNSLYAIVDQFDESVDQELQAKVSEINSLAANIAEINDRLARVNGSSGNSGSNSLNDQLDKAVTELSSLIGINTYAEASGGLNITTKSGQVLVSGASSSQFSTQADPLNPSKLDVTYSVSGSNVVITDTIKTGELGGLLNVRTDVLDKARSSLGRMAAGIALSFNTQQAAGRDLNGVAGGDLFSITPAPAAQGEGTVTGAMTVAFNPTQVTQLTTSDYRITFDGTDYISTRLSDNTQTNLGTGPALAVDGLSITVTTGASTTDSFLIQPTRSIAGQISTTITDPAEIAAAANPFTGVGDNTNALAMADFQLSKTLDGGNSTFNDANSLLIGDLGTKSRQAKNSLEAMQAVEQSAIEARDNVSGVNLDEEAADMLKFQQAYQAAARMISVGNELFGTLLQAVR
ncbi:MAG: flagellar hook-associated protein FlgK [Gammaproteobacteria bacterium]